LDDKSEKVLQKVSEYLIIFEFMKPVLVEKYFDVGCRPQTIACFAVKPTVNWTVQLD
jgi:hypothetical protein